MSIEKKKAQLEMMKMDSNIMESEIRIEERLEEIERIKVTISKYNERRDELSQKLGEME